MIRSSIALIMILALRLENAGVSEEISEKQKEMLADRNDVVVTKLLQRQYWYTGRLQLRYTAIRPSRWRLLGSGQLGKMPGPDPSDLVRWIILVSSEPQLAFFSNHIEDLTRNICEI